MAEPGTPASRRETPFALKEPHRGPQTFSIHWRYEEELQTKERDQGRGDCAKHITSCTQHPSAHTDGGATESLSHSPR